MAQITGTITVNTEKIYPEHLSLNFCYLKDNLKQEVKIISSQVFNDYSFVIEYDPREVNSSINHFIEIRYAGLSIRTSEFSLNANPGSGKPLDTAPNFLTQNIDLANLSFTVEVIGKVKTSRDVPCGGITFDCEKIGLANNTRQNGTTTNNNGECIILLTQSFGPYINGIDPKNYSELKTDLDVQLKIFYTENGVNKEASSPIFCDVKERICYDFVIGDESFRGAPDYVKKQSSFDRVATFRSHSGEIDLKYVEYISNKLGISLTEAEQFVRVKNLTRRFNCDEDVMFALVSGNGNGDYRDILFKTNADLENNVYAAIDKNVIYISKSGVPQKISTLKTALISKYITEDEFLSKYGTIGVSTTNAKTSVVNQTIAWMNDAEAHNDGKSLNDYLKEKGALTTAQYNRACVYDSIVSVSGGNSALAKVALTNNTGWTTIDQVIAGKSQITTAINNSAVSIPEPFTSAAEYANHIEKTLKKEFPSQFLRYDITKTSGAILSGSNIKTFLTNNSNFQFGENHAAITLAKSGISFTGYSAGTPRETLQKNLQKVEQLYQLTPAENKGELMQALWNAGLTSAHEISQKPESAFSALVSAQLANNTTVTAEEIKAVYTLSSSIATMTNLVMYEMGLASQQTGIPVIPSYQYESTEANNGLPTIKDLFGSQDYFSYPANRSMLSPAAYLMDLLQFLKNAGGNKLTKLLQRRPDIEHILLNCSNTENSMPYIDLVNEVLEMAVSGVSSTNLQTTWTTEELATYPENLSITKSAYNSLKTVKTPWSLPFHFWVEEYRSYLSQLSLSREEIIKYFSANADPDAVPNESLHEYLGIITEDVTIFRTPTTSTTVKPYYKDQAPSNRLSELIKQTELNYDEIVALLESYYINEDRYIAYSKPGEEVNGSNNEKPGTLEATYIQKSSGNPAVPSISFYDKLHRFERLRKRLNLKVHELDIVLLYLNISKTATINDADFNKIAYLFKIKERGGLKLEEAALLCGNFKCNSYSDYVCLYDYLFLRKTEDYSLKADFEKLKNGASGMTANFKYNKIQAILPYISGIKITEDQYNRIILGEGITKTATPDLAGLSQILRVVYLCNMLGISEDEYYFLKSASGISDLTNPKNLWDFINWGDQIKTYGFSIPNLAYIIDGRKIESAAIYMSDAEVRANLKNIQQALKPLHMDEGFYQNHIVKNINAYFESYIEKAIEYVFENFTNNSSVVGNFLTAHPDLFCNFLKASMAGTQTLRAYFLANGSDTEKKLRAVLVGLGLEESVTPTAIQKKEQYYSKEDIRNIFRKIKSKVLIGILDESNDFKVVIQERFMNTSLAAELVSQPSAAKSVNNSVEKSIGKTQHINDDVSINKYTNRIEGTYIDLNTIHSLTTETAIKTFINNFRTNNALAFPASYQFLLKGSSNYLEGKMARFKKFVFEKDVTVYDIKLNDLKKSLLKYLDELSLDSALEIILIPGKVFENGDTNNKIRDFISEHFGKFMPKAEAISKLYKIENGGTNNGGALTKFITPQYLENYCDRIDLVLDYLKQEERIDIITRNLSESCKVGEEYAVKFLFDYPVLGGASATKLPIYTFLDETFVNASTVVTGTHSEQINLYKNIYRLAQFVTSFKLTTDMLDDIYRAIKNENSLAESNKKFNLIDIFNISGVTSNILKKYLNFSAAVGISYTYFTEDSNFFKFFNENNNLSSLSAEGKTYVSQITGCPEEDITTLNNNILPKKLHVDWFRYLLECLRIMKCMGVSAETIRGLQKTGNSITADDTEKLRQIVKNKYSEAEWNKIAVSLRNPLRIKQRDALRDYLIINNASFSSSNDLFNYYLIDTEMHTTAKTSRIIQATLSVQMFIQRILMGMESGLSFSDSEKTELIWRKNYRVWEANRKILFFPENWLDPELRHDKTPIFKEIEEKLLQNDIDETLVAQIYNEYIDKLDEVSNLEILAAHRPFGIGNSNNFIAFIGRTKGAPHKYFFRKLYLTGYWTPWEEINNGIKADIVSLAYWKGKIYMFWPEVSTTSNIPEGREKEYYPKGTEISMDTSALTGFTAIKMIWSAYKNGAWTKATYSDDIYVEPCNNAKTMNIIMNTNSDDNKLVNISIYFNLTDNKANDKKDDKENSKEDNKEDNKEKNKEKDKENSKENGEVGSRASYIFDGSRLRLQYVSESYGYDVGWYHMFFKDNALAANFGNNEIINNKAICNSAHDKAKFAINYYSCENKPTANGATVYTIGKTFILFEENAEPNAHVLKYNILYDILAYNKKSWELGKEQIKSYFKPLVMEDIRNNKSYLGIPYGWAGKEVSLDDVSLNIKNLRYQFINFYHPYIAELKSILQQKGYAHLFDTDFHDKESIRDFRIEGKSFSQYYKAKDGLPGLFPTPYHEEISFGNITTSANSANILVLEDPFSIYNWEMFYHIPMLIADNLSRNMQFEEAQKWYHLIFDPTAGGDDPGALKYWRIKPFREVFDNQGNLRVPANIQEFLNEVNAKNYTDLINTWEEAPFNPHLIAKTRKLAYMKYVVTQYLDNIIRWADMYFTKDTMEDINQAALLYILAADILGVRGQKIEGTLSPDKPYSYLKTLEIDGLSNVYVIIDGLLTVMANPDSNMRSTTNKALGTTQYIVSYFTAPHNDTMEGHWDTVIDRLFKIRHSMNIQGVVRELPLTAPPIDPGAVAAAMASGADLSGALNTLSAPLPLYRFNYMLQKAIEFTNDVKTLGTSLLSILEKSDAEDMSILRATHERAVLNSMTLIREKAIEETTKNIEALENSKINVVARRDYYKSKKQVSAREQKSLNLHKKADFHNEMAADLNAMAGIMGLIPQMHITALPDVEFGGVHLSKIFSAYASVQNAKGIKKQNEARETDIMASYERRFEDWAFQGEQAAGELVQIEKQIAASQVRLAMAEQELENHLRQIELKTEEFEFMKEKFTNKQLYNWMKGEVSKLYQQAYQIAHKLALAAEKAFVFEKQREGYSSFITSAYWDNLKEGLMSGELLYQDLRRLEVEYMENNEREIELTKDISLNMINPNALIDLRQTGKCDFEIPEMIYDIDHPGHYLRRIKSVSITIPAVTGPYNGVTCKLSMLNNRFRKSYNVGDQYAYKGLDDGRFVHNIIGIQSIATSSGNNDTGMFEFNFKDERYLPFEGAGAIGRWQVELPDAIRKFNYGTISDVVLHVKYTAKDAGGMLKQAANENIIANINYLMNELEHNNETLIVVHSLKNEFSDQFNALITYGSTSLKIETKHLPYMITDYVARTSDRNIIIKDVLLLTDKVTDTYNNSNTTLTENGVPVTVTRTTGATLLYEEDIYMVIKYKVS
ncbi:MAG: hypothetical protein LBH92_01395 [Bacteroidales bacterium]|jgi:hypothetical protein|nr:hypothetical protein [Bacteroidales bacterium]